MNKETWTDIDSILREIKRQFRCHLAFSVDPLRKKNTKAFIRRSIEKLCVPSTAKYEIECRVGNVFLREHPIPENFKCFTLEDFKN